MKTKLLISGVVLSVALNAATVGLFLVTADSSETLAQIAVEHKNNTAIKTESVLRMANDLQMSSISDRVTLTVIDEVEKKLKNNT